MIYLVIQIVYAGNPFPFCAIQQNPSNFFKGKMRIFVIVVKTILFMPTFKGITDFFKGT